MRLQSETDDEAVVSHAATLLEFHVAGLRIDADNVILPDLHAAGREPIQGTLLEIEPGDPLLLFGRTSFTEGGRTVYHQKRFYRADQVQYRLTLAPTAPRTSTIESFEPVFAGNGS